MPPAIRSIDLPGRVRLPYAEQGDPAGVPVLLVYENAGHALHWEDPARFAADLVAFVERLGAATRRSQ